MKRSIILFFLLVFGGLQAQTDTASTKWRFGIANHASYTRYAESIANALVFTATYKKSQLELGPKFTFFTSNTVKSQYGSEFNYRFYPNGISNRADLQLFINSDYYRLVIKENYEGGGVLVGTRTETTNFVSINVGFGLFFNLWKGLYLGTNLAGGFFVQSSNSTYTAEYWNGATGNDEDSDRGLALNFMAGVSLGYRFK